MVSTAYVVMLNATEQSLFCHGLIRGLSLSSIVTLVGIAFLALCAVQVSACIPLHLYLPHSEYLLGYEKTDLISNAGI